MVPGYGKGGLNVGRTALHGFLCTGGRVVGCSTARQPLLKGGAVFADIMQPRGVFGLLFCTKGCGKSSGKARCAGKMFVDGLGAGAVLGNMCKCFSMLKPPFLGQRYNGRECLSRIGRKFGGLHSPGGFYPAERP